MISKRKETWESKHHKAHRWFAWHPVRVYDDGDNHHWRTVWWEQVWRSGHIGLSGWQWSYYLANPNIPAPQPTGEDEIRR